jgi:hypothetical protein
MLKYILATKIAGRVKGKCCLLEHACRARPQSIIPEVRDDCIVSLRTLLPHIFGNRRVRRP